MPQDSYLRINHHTACFVSVSRFRPLPLLLLCLLFPVEGLAVLRINEVMQANVAQTDEANNLPDSWVELYNPTSSAVQLKGYALRKEDEDRDFVFSVDTLIAPRAYVMVYCDEQDTALHAHFKLKYRKTSTLTLLAPNGEADDVSVPKMPHPGLSFGRSSTDSTLFGWMMSPTPGGRNSASSANVCRGVELSVPSGIADTAFRLLITNPLINTTVRYTTNGDEPSPADSVFPPSGLEIARTTALRVRRFAADAAPSATATFCYLFPTREVTLPFFFITLPEADLRDSIRGIYTEGSFSPDLHNYQFDWQRAADIKYFSKSGQERINEPGVLRVAGGSSRTHPQKSLTLYARQRFSGNEDFNFPFWSEKPHIASVHSVLLRNAGNDFLFAHLRDAVVQTYAGAHISNLDYQSYQPVVVFVNGEYIGLMNLRERTNRFFIETNHPGVGEVDVIENWAKVNSGCFSEAMRFYNLFCKENVTYDELAAEMDMDAYLNYLIVEAYFGNSDYPDNNIVMWRERRTGGKWRWIMKDFDFTLDYQFKRSDPPSFGVFNYFETLFVPPAQESDTIGSYNFSTRLMRKLLSLPTFREQFIERFAVYMGDVLNERFIAPHIDSLAERIEYEFPFTFDRYADYRKDDYADWYREIDILKASIPKRNYLNYESMRRFFALDSLYYLVVNNPHSEDLPYQFTFNGIAMEHTSYEGYYYRNRNITIRTKRKDENAPKIRGWLIRHRNDDAEVMNTEVVVGDSLRFSLPHTTQTKQVVITMLTDEDAVYPFPDDRLPFYYRTAGGIVLVGGETPTEFSVADVTGKTIRTGKLPPRQIVEIRLSPGLYLLRKDTEWKKIFITNNE